MKRKKKCKTCGYVWKPRVEQPVECPNCKSRLIKIKRS
jgi:predicted Zn-ribbon and HTH transcriptional regulator